MMALLALTHNLLEDLLPIWTKLSSSKGVELTASTDLDEALPKVAELRESSSESDIEGTHPAVPKAWPGVSCKRRKKADVGQGAQEADQIDKAMLNKRNRKEVRQWNKLKPGAPLTILCAVASACESLIGKLIEVAGVGWQQKRNVECLDGEPKLFRVTQEHERVHYGVFWPQDVRAVGV